MTCKDEWRYFSYVCLADYTYGVLNVGLGEEDGLWSLSVNVDCGHWFSSGSYVGILCDIEEFNLPLSKSTV